jgi:uncharacterized protein (DUF1015 family)
MPQMFKPFRATFYNPDKFKTLDKVACPPYDVITEKSLAKLRANSPYNFSRVDLAEGGDYQKIGDTFRSWLHDKILVDDVQENFYLCGQQFKVEGKTFWRFGILGALRMDKPGMIRPHEHTHSKAKEDRARMIRETQANLSPVFVIAPKKIPFLHLLYKKYLKTKPFFTFKDAEGTESRLWKISDAATVKKVSQSFEKIKFIIADGHHRFEVAYDFFQEHRDKVKGAESVLAYMVEEQPGLVILPINRVVELPYGKEELFKRLAEYFLVKAVSESGLKTALKGSGAFSFGIRIENKFYLARLKKPAVLDKIIKEKVFRRLDTYVLSHLVYPLLGVEKPCAYANNMQQAKEMAVKGRVVFVMRPAYMKNICDIVDNGFRMPQKSTYFHPKIGSGLVIRRFEL